MSKFKVGNKVRRIDKSGDQTVRTVTEVYDSGWFNHDGGEGHGDYCSMGGCYENYWELAPYSSYFTEQQAKAEPTTGHVSDSPMQKHSKGEFYPLCVVGYSDIGRMAYTIENLEKGTVLGFMPGEFKGGSNIRAWGNAAAAYKFLAERHEVAKSEWVKGRPTFIKNSLGLEIAMLPKHKRWLVKLDKVDLDSNVMLINGVYYKALQQDIG